MRPETKLAAFIALAVAIFLGAHEAGSLVGPVASIHGTPGGSSGSMNTGGGSGSMNMGSSRP